MRNIFLVLLCIGSPDLHAQSKWHYYLANVVGEKSISAVDLIEDSTQEISRFYLLNNEITKSSDSVYFFKEKKWVGYCITEFFESKDSDPSINYYSHRLIYSYSNGYRNGYVSISMLEDKKVFITSWLNNENELIRDTSYVSSRGIIERQLVETR